MKYLADLQKFLIHHQNEENAAPMKQYMKEHFNFLGIKSPERKKLLKEFINRKGFPKREDAENLAVGLWSLQYREYQYIGMELINQLLSKPIPNDIYFLEYMLEYKQWWDTVDFIAVNPVARLFDHYPDLRSKYFHKWNNSHDLWLNRAAILFQLKYKHKTDLNLLKEAILKHHRSHEFFHQKAIGWALRDYAKTDSNWVSQFVNNNELPSLSKREALRNL